MFFQTRIDVTDREDIIYNVDRSRTIVISLDEDNVLLENAANLVGTCLLPPVQAKIAEADGNEGLYDTIYGNHLLEPRQQEFVSVILTCLYKGRNIILFLPEIGYTNTKEKLIKFMYELYGIHIGMIGSPNPNLSMCYYDDRCIPIWANMIYSTRAIDCFEYLYLYPADAPLKNNKVIDDLVMEINPYGKTFNDKINYISELHSKIHLNPKVRPAITDIRRN